MDINAVIGEVSKERCSVHVICMHMLDLRGLFKTILCYSECLCKSFQSFIALR